MSDFVREGVSLILKKNTPHATLPLEKIAGKFRPIAESDLKQHDRAWVNSIR
jgi:Arc/MetJ-type ribon-helix-helix transcriptional regulator